MGMKIVTLQTLLLPIIGWVFDFQHDNKRLPESLDDLVKNKSGKRDYDPARALKRNQEQGFIISYTMIAVDSFELKIEKDSDCLLYKNQSKTLYYYRNNVLEQETIL
jgi:hypothetical protein